MMIYIETKTGNKIFDVHLIHSVYNYKIYYLIESRTFFIINTKNQNLNGFIINDSDSLEEKGYYYYNLVYKKVYYLNKMDNDSHHHTDTKDMSCATKELLEQQKIEKYKQILC